MARQKGSRNRPKEEIEREKREKAARRAAREAGGSTGTKSSSPRPGEIGHNSELTEEEKQSRFVIGLAEIERLKGEADTANSHVRNERKRLMAYGFTKAQIDFALELRKTKPEDAVADWRRLMLAARFINHPIGTQPDMFDEAAAVDEPIERAKKAGHLAGLEGEPCKPPHAADSPEGQAWIEAWHIGVTARNTAMNAAVQATEAKPPAGDAAEAFDDAMPDAPVTAPEGEGAGGGESGASEDEAAAGHQAFREALRDNIKSGDEHNRQTEAKIQEERSAEPATA